MSKPPTLASSPEDPFADTPSRGDCSDSSSHSSQSSSDDGPFADTQRLLVDAPSAIRLRAEDGTNMSQDRPTESGPSTEQPRHPKKSFQGILSSVTKLVKDRMAQESSQQSNIAKRTRKVLNSSYTVEVNDKGDSVVYRADPKDVLATLDSGGTMTSFTGLFQMTTAPYGKGDGYTEVYMYGIDTYPAPAKLNPSRTLQRITGIEELENDALIVELEDPAQVFITNKSNASVWLASHTQTPEYHPPCYLPAPVDYQSLRSLRKSMAQESQASTQ